MSGLERWCEAWQRVAAQGLPKVGAALPARVATGPIGVALGAEALHLVQLESGAGGKLRTRAACVAPFAPDRDACFASPGALKALVGGALREAGFRGRRAVGALAAPDVKLMVLDYVASRDEDEPAAIVQLVGERFAAAPEELVIDYLPIRALGEARSERSALVAVAHRQPVIAHLEALRLAGLELDALEIEPVATRRLVAALGGSGPEENALVLFAGRDAGHLCVLWGRRLVLYRDVEFGERSAVERLAKTLDLDDEDAEGLLRRHGVEPAGPGDGPETDVAAAREIAETTHEILQPSFAALAEEIERARVYTASKARGAAPDRVYLLGAFARWPRADRLLAKLTGIDVRTLDPGRALGAAPTPSPDAALATGFALRGMLADG